MTPSLVKQIANLTLAEGFHPETLSKLRRLFPGTHFTMCREDEVIGSNPVLVQSDLSVYLVDGREHCLRLTNDWDVATGVVLAEVDEP